MDEPESAPKWKKTHCVEKNSPFPQFFKTTSNSNHIRTQHLWKDLHLYLQSSVTDSLSEVPNAPKRVTKAGHKHMRLRARCVRGRKLSARVDAFHKDLIEDFDGFLRPGLKDSLSTLLLLLSDDTLRC